MSKVTNTTYTTVLPQSRLELATVSTGQVGMPAMDTDGKKYRLVQFGEAVTAGKMVQAPAIVADFEDLVVAADVAVGATAISVTLGATGVSANELVGATVFVTNEAGEGISYTVNNHLAAAATEVVVLNLDQAVVAAMTGALTVVSVIANPYAGVINAPTTLTNKVLGVAVTTAAAGDYGFIQTGGSAAVLADGAHAAGTALYASTGVSGAVAAVANGKLVGYALQTLVDTEYKVVDLTIE